jgi:putative transposase
LNKESNLKPLKTSGITTRNLPHWEYPGSCYFVTFKTADGFVLDDISKDITLDTILFHATKKYTLYASIIMSTHVHLVMEPMKNSGDSYFSLAQIMHSIKSYSANKIKMVTGKSGSIWLDERYDRVIRNDDELFEEMSYIINNPVKDGLVKQPEDYKWLYYKRE